MQHLDNEYPSDFENKPFIRISRVFEATRPEKVQNKSVKMSDLEWVENNDEQPTKVDLSTLNDGDWIPARSTWNCNLYSS
jgi:hypothetical protein